MVNNKKLEEYNKLRETINLVSVEQAKEIYELMYVTDLVFTKFDIKYSLHFGSMLGAIRNGGLIPWDDDVDIMTFYPDDRKMFKKEVVGEFNKYGMNVFMQVYENGEKNIKENLSGTIVNGVYKEPTSEMLTNEVIKVNRLKMWTDAIPSVSGIGLLNKGKSLRQSNTSVLDIFPVKKNPDSDYWGTPHARYENNSYMSAKEIWPLKKTKFGSIDVSIVNNPEKLCKRWMGETCLKETKWTHSHTGLASKEDKKLVEENSDLLLNLEVPCLFDPVKFMSG